MTEEDDEKRNNNNDRRIGNHKQLRLCLGLRIVLGPTTIALLIRIVTVVDILPPRRMSFGWKFLWFIPRRNTKAMTWIFYNFYDVKEKRYSRSRIKTFKLLRFKKRSITVYVVYHHSFPPKICCRWSCLSCQALCFCPFVSPHDSTVMMSMRSLDRRFASRPRILWWDLDTFPRRYASTWDKRHSRNTNLTGNVFLPVVSRKNLRSVAALPHLRLTSQKLLVGPRRFVDDIFEDSNSLLSILIADKGIHKWVLFGLYGGASRRSA